MLVDFGFKKIRAELKTKRVQDLFNRVAENYDLMNDAMSFGLHRCWKSYFVNSLPLKQGAKIIDLAGGTGDIAVKILKTYPYLQPQITVCDLTPNMLFEGRDRCVDQGVLGVQWVCGNGEILPFKDQSVDCITMSFGLRNVTNISAVLAEAFRVLKAGGSFHCLEFNRVENNLFRKAYEFYSFQIIPMIGQAIAKDRDSYQYLVESIKKFPDQETLAQKFAQAGFSGVRFDNLMNGIVSHHRGYVR